MQVYVDNHRHVYLQVNEQGKGKPSVYITTHGKRRGIVLLRLTSKQAWDQGLRPYDSDPVHVAQTWDKSTLEKSSLVQTWINKILGRAQTTGGSAPLNSTSKEIQMFYVVSKDGDLQCVAKSLKEANSDLAELEEDLRAKCIVVGSEAELAGALSLNAMLALGNNEDVLQGGPEFTKFKNKADGAKQVWELLELAYNEKVKAAAQKAAAAAAKEKEKADKAAAKAAKQGEKKVAKVAKEVKDANGEGTRQRYSGKRIEVLDSDISKFRENTWTRFMVESIISNDTCDAAQVAIDSSKEYSGRRADFNWAVKKGIIAVHDGA